MRGKDQLSRENIRRWSRQTTRLIAWLRRQELLVSLIVLFLVVIGIWGVIELADEVQEGETQKFDKWVVHILRNPDEPALPRGPRELAVAARDITALGSYPVLILVVLSVTGYLLLQRTYGAMWLLLIATTSGGLISNFLKMLFDRTRPENFMSHLTWTTSASFPSGHSLLSAVVYLSLGTLLARIMPKRTIKVYFLGVALSIIFLVGISRVYLGVHYPTDVLAGWSVGLVWAMICWLVAQYLQRRGVVEKDSGSKSPVKR